MADLGDISFLVLWDRLLYAGVFQRDPIMMSRNVDMTVRCQLYSRRLKL